jgi:hypothetical protein
MSACAAFCLRRAARTLQSRCKAPIIVVTPRAVLKEGFRNVRRAEAFGERMRPRPAAAGASCRKTVFDGTPNTTRGTRMLPGPTENRRPQCDFRKYYLRIALRAIANKFSLRRRTVRRRLLFLKEVDLMFVCPLK